MLAFDVSLHVALLLGHVAFAFCEVLTCVASSAMPKPKLLHSGGCDEKMILPEMKVKIVPLIQGKGFPTEFTLQWSLFRIELVILGPSMTCSTHAGNENRLIVLAQEFSVCAFIQLLPKALHFWFQHVIVGVVCVQGLHLQCIARCYLL